MYVYNATKIIFRRTLHDDDDNMMNEGYFHGKKNLFIFSFFIRFVFLFVLTWSQRVIFVLIIIIFQVLITHIHKQIHVKGIMALKRVYYEIMTRQVFKWFINENRFIFFIMGLYDKKTSEKGKLHQIFMYIETHTSNILTGHGMACVKIMILRLKILLLFFVIFHLFFFLQWHLSYSLYVLYA